MSLSPRDCENIATSIELVTGTVTASAVTELALAVTLVELARTGDVASTPRKASTDAVAFVLALNVKV